MRRRSSSRSEPRHGGLDSPGRVCERVRVARRSAMKSARGGAPPRPASWPWACGSLNDIPDAARTDAGVRCARRPRPSPARTRRPRRSWARPRPRRRRPRADARSRAPARRRPAAAEGTSGAGTRSRPPSRPGQRQGAPPGWRRLGARLDAPRRPGRRLLREDRLHRRALDLRGAARGQPGARGLRAVRHGPRRRHGPPRADVVPRRRASARAARAAARTTPRTSTSCWPTAGGHYRACGRNGVCGEVDRRQVARALGAKA